MLLESVPNVSEGRRSDVIREIAAAAGQTLIDLSSDNDHHRSVLTLAGERAPLESSLLELYRVALDRIDLTRHEGVHPRIGAVDVVPIVPLGRASLDDAVIAARVLAERVAERFELPVFLYEAAATADHRRNLADLRRGGAEGLAARMGTVAWRPDFGPERLDPRRGATAIGARGFLIAFNAELETDDVRLARRIARAIRESSGGLPAVKAMGVFLPERGRAQVSMNLVDFRRTPPRTVVEAIRAEARALGTRLHATELVGLIPAAALEGASAEELQLRDFHPDRVLEERLRLRGLVPD